jgi:hypothetical protein
MSTGEGLLTYYQHLPAVDPDKPGLAYVFATLDKRPSLEECLALHVKYFESHHKPLVPYGQVLFVDLRPAFRKPLADVTPTFHVIDQIPKNATPPES